VVALNRAVAVAEVEGADAALAYEAALARSENAVEHAFLERSCQLLSQAEAQGSGATQF
jgi:predicted RNA polymerase sigma factor